MVVGVIGALATFFAGTKRGQGKFINAVQEAAHIVIKDLRDECRRLREQHSHCEAKLAHMQRQIDMLVNPPGPPGR